MNKICGCIQKNTCKSCSYPDLINMPALEYDYWNQTFWQNNATTDGWGATLGITNQGLDTGDNYSGYVISNTRSSSNNKKLKRFYEYQGKFYESASTLIFIGLGSGYLLISQLPQS